MFLGFFYVILQKEVDKDLRVELEFSIVFDLFVLFEIHLDPIELEVQNVWRPTHPSFCRLVLPFFQGGIVRDSVFPTCFPPRIQILIFNIELNGPHFIHIGVSPFPAAIFLVSFSYLNLTPKEVFPD